MAEALHPPCDVCGKQATHWVRDTLRHEPIGEMYVSWSPVGVVRYGCDEHPVESVEVGVTQLPNTFLASN